MENKQTYKKFFKIFPFLGIIFLISCDTVKSAVGIKPAKVWLEKITFRADDNMNDSSPVKVHVVIPYKDDLAGKLGGMDATTYFQQAAKLKSDAGDDLDVFSVDIVPGTTETVLEIAPKSSAGVIALMFARYSTPGDHRTNVSADYELKADMGKNDLKVTIIKKG
jgi:type VI secretion system protein